VSTKRTSTVADSSIHSTTRRTSKAALLRVKVATVVGAVALFLASLTGIAIFNPQAGYEAAGPVVDQQITIVEPGGSDALLLAPPPSVCAVRPLVRSRGS